MLPAEKKQAFIKLRAEGLSYRSIAAEINIGRTTCARWENEFRGEIAALRAEQLKAIYAEFSITREARIRKLGEILNRMEAEIRKKDLSEIPADKLVELYIKYSKILESDYIIPAEPIAIREPKDLLYVLGDLVNRLRSGEITEEQVRRESLAINTMLKAYETIELQTKVDKLESILLGRVQELGG